MWNKQDNKCLSDVMFHYRSGILGCTVIYKIQYIILKQTLMSLPAHRLTVSGNLSLASPLNSKRRWNTVIEEAKGSSAARCSHSQHHRVVQRADKRSSSR